MPEYSLTKLLAWLKTLVNRLHKERNVAYICQKLFIQAQQLIIQECKESNKKINTFFVLKSDWNLLKRLWDINRPTDKQTGQIMAEVKTLKSKTVQRISLFCLQLLGQIRLSKNCPKRWYVVSHRKSFFSFRCRLHQTLHFLVFPAECCSLHQGVF